MAPNDAAIDMPLEMVQTNSSQAALRNPSSSSLLRPPVQPFGNTPAEKHSLFNGRRVKKVDSTGQPTGHMGFDGEEDTINTMGKIYLKILNFSIVTRYFLYVLPLAAIIAAPIVVGATVARGAAIGGVPLIWFFAWVEIVWLSIWVSKIVAHFLPVIFQLVAGVVSSGVRKYSVVIRSLEIPLSLVGWAVTSLATFIPIMTRNPTNIKHKTPEWEWIMQKILAAAVVSSLIYLGEKFIIQLISINYHRKQFTARIKQSKHNVYLLSLLYDASRTVFPMYCNDFAEEDYIIADQLDFSNMSGKHSHQRSGSATPMHLIQDFGRFGDKITSAFGNVASEITGKRIFDANSSHSIVVEALEKTCSAEALSKRIWMSFVVEGKESLYLDDIIDVLGHEHGAEATEAFAALDRDANGDISMDEMILTVSEFGRERKSIANSMHDVDQAINVLDQLLCMVVFVAVVFVFVAFLNVNFTTTLATTGTALLSLSFVFSATCQEVLGSCIFLFVKHPYDIGDRVDVSQDQFVVDHISLLFTVFRRISGTNIGRSVQIPNIVLNTLWIENVSRSKTMSEQLTVSIAFGTSFEDIKSLKNELAIFVQDPENKRDFQQEFDVDVLGTSDMTKLDLRVEIKHKSNWANETIRAARRSKFMCALVAALRRVPIAGPGGAAPPLGDRANPSYSVAINDSEAKYNKDCTAAATDAARLMPKNQPESIGTKAPDSSTTSGSDLAKGNTSGMTHRENNIINDLSSRDPAADAARDEAWTSSREDSSTLGDRPSIDHQDLEDVRDFLRRESTRGRRKTGAEGHMPTPSVPTITESDQSPLQSSDHAASHSPRSLENQIPRFPAPGQPAPYILMGQGARNPQRPSPQTTGTQY